MRILTFGGTSVADATAIHRVVDRRRPPRRQAGGSACAAGASHGGVSLVEMRRGETGDAAVAARALLALADAGVKLVLGEVHAGRPLNALVVRRHDWFSAEAVSASAGSAR